MPTLPNSLTTTAVPSPSGVARKRRRSVVFPAPRKPVMMVTGIRAPRACLSLRPNGPASREGKRSSNRVPCSPCVVIVRASGQRRLGRALARPNTVTRVRWVSPELDPTYKGGPPAWSMRENYACSKFHFQDVEPAHVTIHGVDDLALVHEHVVELNGAGRRQGRRRRNEDSDFLRLVRIGDVVGA
jgi:hypothetical protein